MYTYKHKIKYYETDKMGITHHSNYVRFMEESRVAWMDSIGYGYKKCEEQGLISPVVSISCDFKKTTTFDDELTIEVKMVKYNGLRFEFEYTMKKGDDLVCLAKSSHCFLNQSGMPIRIKKEYPELDEIFNKEMIQD